MYKLAQHLLIRDDDQALFDSKRFKIIQMNNCGFKLISYFKEKSISKDELIRLAGKDNISINNLNIFLKKCLVHGILKNS